MEEGYAMYATKNKTKKELKQTIIVALHFQVG